MRFKISKRTHTHANQTMLHPRRYVAACTECSENRHQPDNSVTVGKRPGIGGWGQRGPTFICSCLGLGFFLFVFKIIQIHDFQTIFYFYENKEHYQCSVFPAAWDHS